MKRTKKGARFWAALVILSLTGQVAWVVENMYFNVFIYKMFSASAAAISTMVAASAIAAALTTIFIGALSDKIGKRKLFICGGYILWGISIAAFALIRIDVINAIFPGAASAAACGVSIVIIMDCVMTFFGSSANDACFNAWLTDSTDETNRGSAEGLNSMMPLIAILVVFGSFMFFDLDESSSWVKIFLIIGAAVFIIGIIGLFIVDESAAKKEETSNYIQNIIYSFRPKVICANPKLYLTLAAFIVFSISIQIFFPYLILYYEVSLGMENYVLVMAPAIVAAAVVTAFYGRLYDRLHFKKSVIPAIILLLIGYVFLYLFRSTALVFIGSLFMMCGYLTGMAVFGAMIRDCTPRGRAGMFQGVRIICQVLIPGVIGPYIGALVLRNADTVLNDDGTTSFIPNANIYLAAFIAAVCVFFVMIPLFKKLKKEGI